jgi:hypothetical protein
VILTFTDFSLPGDNGTSLTLQRTFNVKQGGGWEIGVAGVPMRVLTPRPKLDSGNSGGNDNLDAPFPRLNYADVTCRGRNHPEGGEPSWETFARNKRYQANNLLERADPCR